MIKNYLLLFLSILCFTSQAQNFTVSPNPSYVEVDLDMNPGTYEIFTQTSIVNNTSDTLFLKWNRIINNMPDCWETSTWSINIQALPFTDSMEFLLMPNSTTDELNVHTYLDGLGAGTPSSGEAEIVLKISNLNDLSDTLSVTYNFSATGGTACITTISSIEKEAIKIYPNPTGDFFQLTEIPEARQVIIYNILGNQVKTFDLSQGQNYYISDLTNGIYVLKVVDEKQRIMHSTKLYKN